MGNKGKTRYKSHKDAESALYRIWDSGELRDKTPIRAYKENGWWYLTSKEKIGANETETREITPEQVKERLDRLTNVRRVQTKTGKSNYAKLPMPVLQAIIADAVSGEYSLAQIAERHNVVYQTVSTAVSNWIKDKRLIRQLKEENDQA